MPSISRAQAAQYMRLMHACQTQAAAPVEALWSTLDAASTVDAAAQIMAEAMALQVEAYGDAMAQAMAEFLASQLDALGDGQAAQAVRDAAAEALAEVQPPDRDALESKARYNVAKARAHPDAAEAAGRAIGAATEAAVKQRAYMQQAGVIAKSTATAEQRNYRPVRCRVAWVPGDARPCAFCTMLAGRGMQRAQKSRVMDYSAHVHPNCRCELMIVADGVTLEGYSAAPYRKRMADAAATLGLNAYTEELSAGHWVEIQNALRRQDYEQDGDKIRAQHRAEYARTHDEKQ